MPERLASAGAVTFAEAAPLADMMVEPNLHVAARSPDGAKQQVLVIVARRRIGTSYFGTLGIPLLRGREFSKRDLRENAAQSIASPVILNQTAARDLFGADDPIGRIVEEGKQPYSVIGIVPDTKPAFLQANAVPTIYVPLEVSRGATIILRAAPGSDAMTVVRNELATLHSGLTIFDARTLRESFDQLKGVIRMGSVFYFGIGVFGLVLASIGLAGVTAYGVSRRRREIGIRMALGARSRQVLQLVLKEGAALVAVGSVLGFAAAFAASRALAYTVETMARIFALGTSDLWLLVGAPLLLVLIAMVACYIPARRCTRIALLSALREE
jgi:ABC-type antimicrobial peptide transport system permease subunit